MYTVYLGIHGHSPIHGYHPIFYTLSFHVGDVRCLHRPPSSLPLGPPVDDSARESDMPLLYPDLAELAARQPRVVTRHSRVSLRFTTTWPPPTFPLCTQWANPGRSTSARPPWYSYPVRTHSFAAKSTPLRCVLCCIRFNLIYCVAQAPPSCVLNAQATQTRRTTSRFAC